MPEKYCEYLVVPRVKGIAVYKNSEGDVFIHQDGDDRLDPRQDQIVIIPRSYLADVIVALTALQDDKQ